MKTSQLTIILAAALFFVAPLIQAQESTAKLSARLDRELQDIHDREVARLVAIKEREEQQRREIQAYSLFAQVQYFARVADSVALVEVRSQPGLADGPLAVYGLPETMKGAKWKGNLYPCGQFQYKLLNGTAKKVKKYAVSLDLAMLSLYADESNQRVESRKSKNVAR